MKRSLVVLSIFSSAIFLQGCSDTNSSSSNSTEATISFATYTAINNQVPIINSLLNMLSKAVVQPAMAATSNIALCIRRVRFKSSTEDDASNVSEDEDNDDLSGDDRVGQKGYLLVSSGGSFGKVRVPRPKIANRFRIDVDNHCSGHSAAEFTTSAASFSTNSNFTMEFRSSTQIDLTQNATVTLNWQAINTALNALSAGASDSNIVNALSTRGSM